MIRLTITEPAFRGLAARFTADPGRTALCAAGLSRLPDRHEFLLHEVAWEPTRPDPERPHVVLCAATTASELPRALRRASSQLRSSGGLAFALGVDRAATHLTGLVSTHLGLEPLAELAVAGAGMPLVHLTPPDNDGPPLETDSDTWSRTIGALGEATWRRITSLRVAVIGCGRTGSLVATSLARLGVRTITLIDPDTLELHNLGEMDGVEACDVGRYKTSALADFLIHYTSAASARFRAIHESVFSLPALVELKASDFLFCCVDNAPARLGTSFLAKLYLKPMIDIGTGILRAGARQTMGADVRLVLPDRCLLCFGGIRGIEQALTHLLDLSHYQNSHLASTDWRRQRAGSLHSLNQMAVSFALRVLEEFVGGRVEDNTWLQVDVDELGMPQVRQGRAPKPNECRLCRITGFGDFGVHLLRSLVRPEYGEPGPQ